MFLINCRNNRKVTKGTKASKVTKAIKASKATKATKAILIRIFHLKIPEIRNRLKIKLVLRTKIKKRLVKMK